MANKPEMPFDNIDSAREYVGLLCEALEEAKGAVGDDIALARSEGALRRLEALQLVTHKLDMLGRHLDTSHRLLNDLRTLHRLLLRERRDSPPAGPPEETTGEE